MIVPIDTMVTEGTVATPWSPNYLTVRAEATRLHRVEQFDEVKLGILLDNARVTTPDNTAEKDCCTKQCLTTIK